MKRRSFAAIFWGTFVPLIAVTGAAIYAGGSILRHEFSVRAEEVREETLYEARVPDLVSGVREGRIVPAGAIEALAGLDVPEGRERSHLLLCGWISAMSGARLAPPHMREQARGDADPLLKAWQAAFEAGE